LLEAKLAALVHQLGSMKRSAHSFNYSYVMGLTNEISEKNFRAFAVAIIGSRQILVWEMGRDGGWISDF
jgi:hypothetical protein